MNIIQIEHFLTIVSAGSFSGAAESAYISQSSLSKQIKALEQELGTALLMRDASGVRLTAAGEIFFDFAREVVSGHKDMREQIARYASHNRSSLRVGALPLLVDYGLSEVLADFQCRHLDIQIDLYEREQVRLVQRLELGSIDLAIIRTEFLDPDIYEWIPLVRDYLVLVVSKNHPLAQAKQVALSDLKKERFTVLDESSALNRLFSNACRRSGFVPNIVYSHSRHKILLEAVERGIGVSALPSQLADIRNPGDFACIPLQDALYTELGLVWPRQEHLTNSAQLLINFFKEAIPVDWLYFNEQVY